MKTLSRTLKVYTERESVARVARVVAPMVVLVARVARVARVVAPMVVLVARRRVGHMRAWAWAAARGEARVACSAPNG
jgi:hypothetical protein